jgi:hypothetical protein
VEYSFTKPSPLEFEIEKAENQFTTKPWVLHVDGTLTLNGSGAGLVLTSLKGNNF